MYFLSQGAQSCSPMERALQIKFRTSFGARHDTFETKDGKEIQVPRHAKDLSSGVERDIKEKLGMR